MMVPQYEGLLCDANVMVVLLGFLRPESIIIDLSTAALGILAITHDETIAIETLDTSILQGYSKPL